VVETLGNASFLDRFFLMFHTLRSTGIGAAAWGCMAAGMLIAGPLSADTVELRGGGHVAGKVLRRVPTSKVPHVIVNVDDGITLALPESQVSRVVTGDQLAEYRRLAAEAGEDPQKHYELARWCAASSLPLGGQKRYHYQRAIALDPDHALARAALMYVKDGNEWILYSEQQRNRGMIRDGGRWKLPEAVAIEKYQSETNETAKRWIKEIARQRSVFLRNTAKSEEAFQELAAIEDPLAAMAIAKEFSENHPRRLRLLWVKLLGRFRNATSVHALTLAGLADSDDVVREAALSELHTFGAASAVDYYRQHLRSNSKQAVRNALRALEYFPNPELRWTYVDALVTQHKTESAEGPGLQAGFGTSSTGTGGGSFSTGSQKTVVISKMRNAAALSMLRQVEPEVDFGYDQQAWREYFAQQLTSYQGDLRRDP